ncbi:hypothetical protein Y032_0095g2787 [Ancylostoma ceylanicum]|uniref:Uncharacterized protein n=1 Tax=Ancylostoma ceylanicum TaxID=53326 RepID=A0A016TKB1_9BILA|nr:hypothetical protein Y032_0095g2787 [Ancylostoma ceylanicum]
MFSLSSDVLFLCNDTGTLIRILCQNESLTLSDRNGVRRTRYSISPEPDTFDYGDEVVNVIFKRLFFPLLTPIPPSPTLFPLLPTLFPELSTLLTPILTSCQFREGRYRHQVSTGCYYRQKGVLKFRPMAGGAVYNITILRGDRVSDAIRKISAKAGNAVNITTHCLCYRNGAQLTEDNEFCLADILTRVIGRKPQVYVAARPENQDDFDDNSYENAYETPLSDIPNGTRIDAETQTCNVLLEGLIQMKMRKTKTLMKTSHVRTAEQDLSKWFPYASRAWISDIPH